MNRRDDEAAALAVCDSVLAGYDVEVVEMSLSSRGRGRVLSIVLDREESPLTLDEITQISEEVSRALDIEDPIEGSYTLDVSTAGIERPLTKPSHFRRFKDREISLKLTEPIEGRRRFTGRILRAGDETFVLEAESARVEVPYDSVARAKLRVDWDAELKRSEQA
jgi:ribosome maturation factor RimP